MPRTCDWRDSLSQKLPSLFAVLKTRQEQILENYMMRSLTGIRNILTQNTHKLELFEKSLSGADPVQILRKGYSITRCNGKVVTGASDLNIGDRLTTVFADGKVESEII